ncbi:con-Ins Im1-like [Haliotis asinina]|uniref:con-Ins Im1-like n=1 Tax=Haliotis asinina TaxID=109174 RepID=UPI0035321F6E
MLLRVHLWSICLVLEMMFGARPVYAGTTRTCFLQDRNPHPRGVCDNVPEVMREMCGVFGRNARSVGSSPPRHAAQTANGTSPRKRCLVEYTKNFPEHMKAPQHCSLLHYADCQKGCAPGGEAGHSLALRQSSGDVQSGQELVKYRTSKKSAFSYLPKRTGTQGFICECCWNQCSAWELKEYCGP